MSYVYQDNSFLLWRFKVILTQSRKGYPHLVLSFLTVLLIEFNSLLPVWEQPAIRTLRRLVNLSSFCYRYNLIS